MKTISGRTSMHILCPSKASLYSTLRHLGSNSLDFIVLVSGAMKPEPAASSTPCLEECVRVLRDGGLLFVQGCPEYLPEIGVLLDGKLKFKYWIAVESTPRAKRTGLPTVHAAVLLFSKGNGRFNVGRARFPHQTCGFCAKSLRDWGGKSHLMNPEGHALSDVWMELPAADNYTQISAGALGMIMRMLDFRESSDDSGPRGLVGPIEGVEHWSPPKGKQYPHIECGKRPVSEHVNDVPSALRNVVHCGDALEVLKLYPDSSVDLVFADPPYNLNKAYSTYDDGEANSKYVGWCNEWLAEYARILKPTGSLYVLNLPRWSMYHAAFLNDRLYFQNWIVWNALSEPRGKLMPAHYGLLFYTKHPSVFTFNYSELGSLDSRDYCLRAACIRKRKLAGNDAREPLTDFWWDVHRIKHPRDRDYHPCQLPDALMERIIRLSSNPGDVVLDALCGTGTTPVVAAKLGRHYVGIDLDEAYVNITKEKLDCVQRNGSVQRTSIQRPRQDYSKRELQLQLRSLASKLGRLPTPDDVSNMTQYSPEVFLAVFPTWGKALKAAKLEAWE